MVCNREINYIIFEFTSGNDGNPKGGRKYKPKSR